MTITLEREEMKKIPKQSYTLEFKELAVGRVVGGESISGVAKELGMYEQTLRNWVRSVLVRKLNGVGIRDVTPQAIELSQLRAENARLKRENEILKKAAAYFAKDAL